MYINTTSTHPLNVTQAREIQIQRFPIFEPEANLDKEMVLHRGYLLGGSYHGHDLIFLLNCYGVRWQVEVKQTYANAMSVVGPVWLDFVSKNITQDVKCLHFIEEGKDMFYVTDPVEPKGKFSLTVFSNAGEVLTAYENYASYVLQNSNFHIGQEPDYNLERMGWHIKRLSRQAQTARICFSGCKKLEFKLCKKSKSVEMFSTTTLRDMVGF
ncbi:hypothetical protein Tco_0584070 [Tanacetum coccineum]